MTASHANTPTSNPQPPPSTMTHTKEQTLEWANDAGTHILQLKMTNYRWPGTWLTLPSLLRAPDLRHRANELALLDIFPQEVKKRLGESASVTFTLNTNSCCVKIRHNGAHLISETEPTIADAVLKACARVVQAREEMSS